MKNENVRLARRWFEEVWNQRRTDTIDELLDRRERLPVRVRDVAGTAGRSRIEIMPCSSWRSRT